MKSIFILISLVISVTSANPVQLAPSSTEKSADQEFCLDLLVKLSEEAVNRNPELHNTVRRSFINKADEAIDEIDRTLAAIQESTTISDEGKTRALRIATASKNYLSESPYRSANHFDELYRNGKFRNSEGIGLYCLRELHSKQTVTTEVKGYMERFSEEVTISKVAPDQRCNQIIHDIFEAFTHPDHISALTIYIRSTKADVKQILDTWSSMNDEIANFHSGELVMASLAIMQHTLNTDYEIFDEIFTEPLAALGTIGDVEAATRSELGEQMHRYCSSYFRTLEGQRDATLASMIATKEN